MKIPVKIRDIDKVEKKIVPAIVLLVMKVRKNSQFTLKK